MRGQSTTDRFIGELATRQHGVVSRRQLLAVGIGGGAIDRRLAHGRLHSVHRGVYAVGHRVLGPHGRWMAAVLACGEGAALSYISAATAWGIRRAPESFPPIHVTAADGGRCKRPGIRAHRDRLHPHDVTVHTGIPITTPSRTLVDLAAVARSTRAIEQALDEARYLRLLDRAALEATMQRAARGVHTLRRVLASHAPGSTRTRSHLEEAFLDLTRTAGLPSPLVNAKVGRMTVDFLWPTPRVVIETDGAAYHDTAVRHDRDRRRDALLRRWGYRVVRVTEADLRERPLAVTRIVAEVLEI